jgi:hypothetical protein
VKDTGVWKEDFRKSRLQGGVLGRWDEDNTYKELN